MKQPESLFTLCFATLLLLLITIDLRAQTTGTVKGIITDEKGKPAAHATLSILKTQLSTFAGADGAFEWRLPSGRHKIIVSMIGYETGEMDVAVSAGKTSLIKLRLKESENREMEGIIVQTATEKRRMETSGFAVTVIETKEASLRNLTTNELLDRAVGVRVRQNGGIGSQVEYNLNGMSGNTVGLFLDGIEISTYGQSFNLNNIPPAMIERIEVYKGVLPSHLTGDYVGGAINVILKRDASRNNVSIATSYGSFGTFQSDIGATFRDKKTGLSGRASGFYANTANSFSTWGRSTTYVNHLQQITRPYRARRFNNDYRSVGGRFELGFTDVKWANQFFLGYNVSNNYNEIPHGTTMAVPYVGRFNKTDAHVFSLNYSKKDLFIKGLALNVNAVHSSRSTYLQDTVGLAYNWDGTLREVIEFGERKPLFTTGGGQQGEKLITQIDRKIINARSNLGYSFLPGHRISVNHKFETTDRDDNDLLNPINKDLVTLSRISKTILSFNYEAQTINNKLKTNLLVKYTSNRTSRSRPELITQNGQNSIVKKDTATLTDNFGYGATVSYNILPKFYLIASGENGFVMPDERQLYGDPETNIQPNLALKPEKNVNINAGFRAGAFEFGKHKLSFYGSAFWRNGLDKITQQVVDQADIQDEADADIQTTRFINLGKTQARGVEGEIIYVYNNRLNAIVNFSKFNNLFKGGNDASGAAHDLYNQQVPNEPFFTVNANLQYRMNDLFQEKSILNIYYNTGYVGQFYTVWGQPEWSATPTQFTHDIGVSYRFPKGRLVASLDGKNILNAEAYDNFMVQKPGRGIYVKINYTISKFL